MYTIYNKLKEIAEKEFEDIVKATNFIGGKASALDKLRIYFIQRKLVEYGIKNCKW